MDSEVFITEDAKLAAYLCIIGHDRPIFRLDDHPKVRYEFTGSINQACVLSFYSRDLMLLSPLAIIEKYQELVAGAKLAVFDLSADVFQS